MIFSAYRYKTAINSTWPVILLNESVWIKKKKAWCCFVSEDSHSDSSLLQNWSAYTEIMQEVSRFQRNCVLALPAASKPFVLFRSEGRPLKSKPTHFLQCWSVCVSCPAWSDPTNYFAFSKAIRLHYWLVILE